MAKTTAPKAPPDVRDLSREFIDHGMSMDVRHAQMVGDFIKALPPCDVYEVGCYHGVSTGEILTAAKQRVWLVDYPRFQHNVMKMAELRATAMPVTMSTDPAATFLESLSAVADGSVILLDGDHRWGVVQHELALCLKLGFTRMILHDVANPVGDCDGPAKALTVLQKEGFFIVIDQQSRAGERTDRGLAFCCKSADDYKLALEAVCARC